MTPRYERRYVSHANEYVLALAYNSYDNVSILCKLKPKHREHLDMISVTHLLQGLLTGQFSSDTGGLLGNILLCGAEFTTGPWAKINKDSILMFVQRNLDNLD